MQSACDKRADDIAGTTRGNSRITGGGTRRHCQGRFEHSKRRRKNQHLPDSGFQGQRRKKLSERGQILVFIKRPDAREPVDGSRDGVTLRGLECLCEHWRHLPESDPLDLWPHVGSCKHRIDVTIIEVVSEK
jgi:hypothetical protein